MFVKCLLTSGQFMFVSGKSAVVSSNFKVKTSASHGENLKSKIAEETAI
jgi:hypothetical protein